jgi:hypothetical protein
MARPPQGHSAAGRIRSIEKSNDLIGIRRRGPAAYSIELQTTTLPRAPKNDKRQKEIYYDGKMSMEKAKSKIDKAI